MSVSIEGVGIAVMAWFGSFPLLEALPLCPISWIGFKDSKMIVSRSLEMTWWLSDSLYILIFSFSGFFSVLISLRTFVPRGNKRKIAWKPGLLVTIAHYSSSLSKGKRKDPFFPFGIKFLILLAQIPSFSFMQSLAIFQDFVMPYQSTLFSLLKCHPHTSLSIIRLEYNHIVSNCYLFLALFTCYLPIFSFLTKFWILSGRDQVLNSSLYPLLYLSILCDEQVFYSEEIFSDFASSVIHSYVVNIWCILD